ncbi:MAG: respiratory nitrate reductase subunit gamma [Gammaproteobacteria bacterium]
MSFLTGLFALLFYGATALLIYGLYRKIRQYATTPAPLKIPTMPAPVTQGGVVFRMVTEVLFFGSLFRSNKWIWVFAYLFHFGMFIALVRHLRYFGDSVPTLIVLMQWIGIYAGIAMVVGLIGLWGRRFLVDRVRYISAPSDHLMLALLLGIGVSGVLMSQHVAPVDIVGLKGFMVGLYTFNWQPLPADPLLLIHLLLVIVLMIVFPISKLLHAPGVFFSPTRNQIDNPREKRHVADWAVVKFESNIDSKAAKAE